MQNPVFIKAIFPKRIIIIQLLKNAEGIYLVVWSIRKKKEMSKSGFKWKNCSKNISKAKK